MKMTTKSRILLGTLLSFWMAIANQAMAAETLKIAYIEPLSGAFANVGELGLQHFRFAAEKINEEGGIMGMDVEIVPMDNKQSASQSVQLVQRSVDNDIPFVTQGNGSNVAGAIVEAVDRNNRRNPDNRILFLNYAAVDPALTNERCSFYHFRFDANSEIKLEALTNFMAEQDELSNVYLINQDYSHGQAIQKIAREMLDEKRPDVEIVGDVLHPIGQVRDFAPYVSRIKQSDADAIITGNWGNDLSLLVRAADSADLDTKFYTYYGGGLGVPSAIGESGEGMVYQITEWHSNVNLDEGLEEYDREWNQAYKERYPETDWYYHRIYNQMYMLKMAVEQAGTTEADEVAAALEGMTFESSPTGSVTMRADDHQLLQPMYISEMTADVKYDVENSGMGFRTIAKLPVDEATVPTTCEMERP